MDPGVNDCAVVALSCHLHQSTGVRQAATCNFSLGSVPGDKLAHGESHRICVMKTFPSRPPREADLRKLAI